MSKPTDENPRSPDPAPADRRVVAEMLPLVYDKLRALAQRYIRQERGYQTLQPTALVHEAYIRLIDTDRIQWTGKTHFFAMAATQMRRVLVERARAASTAKRGSRAVRITLDDRVAAAADDPVDVLALDQALHKLTCRSARQARIAEQRLFSGMLFGEIGAALDISERTARRDWKMAQAWLARELRSGSGSAP